MNLCDVIFFIQCLMKKTAVKKRVVKETAAKKTAARKTVVKKEAVKRMEQIQKRLTSPGIFDSFPILVI